jgi:hypothetical protein
LSAGLPVLKHSLGELGVAAYAGVHVMASTPNFLYANQGYGSFRSCRSSEPRLEFVEPRL